MQPGSIPAEPLQALGFEEKLLGRSEEQLKRRGIAFVLAGFLLILGYPLLLYLTSLPSNPLGGLGWILGILFLTAGMSVEAQGMRYLVYRRVKRLRQYAAARAAAFPTGANPSVKIRCRNCGYLETEGATYCSHCSKPL